MVHQAPNTLTCFDKKQHRQKRRLVGQGFSDAALRGFEKTIMTHIKILCDQVVAKVAPEKMPDSKKPGVWSESQNMARWGK